jgi:hypothetical protein
MCAAALMENAPLDNLSILFDEYDGGVPLCPLLDPPPDHRWRDADIPRPFSVRMRSRRDAGVCVSGPLRYLFVSNPLMFIFYFPTSYPYCVYFNSRCSQKRVDIGGRRD